MSTRDRTGTRAGLGLFAGATVCLGLGCEPATCDEDIRAQVIDERVQLTVGGRTIEAELADELTERERGWMHRRCDREALLLVPDAQGELPIWGCELTSAVDLHLLRDGAVVDVINELAPCEGPCGGCPLVGEGVIVDAVLETPAGTLEVEVGAMVEGLP
ncbi:MAG: DUF192 domain-containing protein [Nannocystaceae bacterium]